MSKQIEAMKQALEALEANVGSYHPLRRSAIITLRTAISEVERYEDEKFKPDWMNYQEGFAAGVLEGREQMKQSAEELRSVERVEPVAWPCVIAEADFEKNTITLEMQCSDYKVGGGQHWLHTTPPGGRQSEELRSEEDCLTAAPVQEPVTDVLIRSYVQALIANKPDEAADVTKRMVDYVFDTTSPSTQGETK
jgi:hypothetical protein